MGSTVQYKKIFFLELGTQNRKIASNIASKSKEQTKAQQQRNIATMMKPTILFLLAFLPFVRARRSSPATPPAVPGIHRMGWGLDEEYIEPEDVDYESVKPVKRVVATDKREDKEDEAKRCLPWGVSCLSDLDMEE